MNICQKLCNECPFSKGSLPGWLSSYTIDDVSNFMSNEALFPCHLMIKENNLNQAEVQHKLESGELKLCRGYLESMIKTCKMPRYNKILTEARELVKQEGTSENSMSMFEFKKHHEQFLVK